LIAKFGTFEQGLAERYRFEEELGRGAMGIVYRATDVRLGRPVAIKMLHPTLTNELGVARFQSEIRIAAGLHHPNIVSVHDSGESDGRLYYVMDYLGGETLRARLKREKQLSVEDALVIVEQVALGLQYAHDHGIVHRDVKPENIILAEGQARVLDFGLARALSDVDTDRLTASGLAVGTPHYLSPEQASAEKDVGPKADQYALACVLYEMLVGEPPFTGPTASSIAMRHISEQPAPLRLRRKTVPGGIERAVLRAMEKVPGDRHAGIAAFIVALHDTINDIGADDARAQPRSKFLPRALWMVAASVLTAAAVAIVSMRTDASATDMVDDGVRWLTNRSLDSARIVVLPFDKMGNAEDVANIERGIREALSRWTDVSVVELADTRMALQRIKTSSQVTSLNRAVGRSVSAGRALSGSVVSANHRITVRVELADTRAITRGRAAQASFSVLPTDDSIYAHLVSQLLFGELAAHHEAAERATRNSVAFRRYLAGHEALRTWALPRADSAFAQALRFDPQFSPAALALAQVRFWSSDDSPEIATLLARAINGTKGLTHNEVLLAHGLSAMQSGRYELACQDYRAVLRKDSVDFGAWFGLGECHRRDSVVVVDHGSATGRVFRGSAQQAFIALDRAFSLLPNVDACCATRSDALLRRVLTTNSAHVRHGVGAFPDTTRYSAYIEMLGDTVGHRPFPTRETLRSPPRGNGMAVEQQRRLFYGIAARRLARTPGNADALEEMAEAMELRGDANTLDTLARARAMSVDQSQIVRLAVHETWLRVRLSVPDDLPTLRRARAIADSLSRNVVPRSAEDAVLLASMAILSGDPGRAAVLSRRGATANQSMGLSGEVMGAAAAYLAFAAVGGPPDSLRRSEEQLVSDINNAVVESRQDAARAWLIGRAVALAYPTYRSPLLEGLDGSDYLIAAERANARGKRDAVRRILASVDRARTAMRASDMTLDALYPEAWLLASVGDSLAALRRITPALVALRASSTNALFEMGNAGALVRAISLKAALMNGMHDPLASRWVLSANALSSTARRVAAH
jgi:tetratricopeptide (TPR) repeat protein